MFRQLIYACVGLMGLLLAGATALIGLVVSAIVGLAGIGTFIIAFLYYAFTDGRNPDKRE